MDATEAVRRLKSDLASHCHTGKASRLRGIIVSPEVWTALSEETGFHGVIGVTGREGSRVIRYSFYVLVSPNFPHKHAADPYYFVGYPKEVYEERYLGEEQQIFASEDRRSKKIQNVTFTELNPIAGIVLVNHGTGGRYYYDVDYDEVIAVAEKSVAAGESPDALISETFADEWRVTNPPQCHLSLKPADYDYDRADISSSVGLMFMQRETRGNGLVHQIVGIGRNGLGDLVEVVMGDSQTDDHLEFARFALKFFLPEEIVEFFHSRGAALPFTWKDGVEVQEQWGQWHDSESLGRLEERSWCRDSGDQRHREISGTFLSTRARSYHFGFTEESVDNWEEFRAQHFPKDWKGWPETAQDRSFASMAQALAD